MLMLQNTTHGTTSLGRGGNKKHIKQAQALGRVYAISPQQAECFYLRLLLHNVKGPQSFAALKTMMVIYVVLFVRHGTA